MPTLREFIANADRTLNFFTLGRVTSPVLVDLFGFMGGFDGFWLDQEHSGLTYEQMLVATAAGRGHGFYSFVRAAPVNYAIVTQCLEAGADGVMAAQVNSAAHAEEFVQWAKFSPRGVRGMNNGGRDALYAGKPVKQFAEESNRDSMVAIQIETAQSLNEVDAIAAIPDVDMLFVGPSDLSQSLGVVGELEHDKVWEGYEQVAAAAKKHGKVWGTVPASPAAAQRHRELGCRMLTFASDVGCLRAGIAAVKEKFGA
ncbi:MAG: aldolase/citrate lyase family protein [Pirellulales bacterium]|nr:aldolase/citrate lyase family protein [Pirellulales bacterium]